MPARRLFLATLEAALLVLCIASPLGAQQRTLLELHGTNPFDFYGFSVASAGDVNADGTNDFVVGSPGDNTAGTDDPGAVFVYSGLDGSLIHVFYGDADNDFLGWSVAGAGDVNNDGYADIVAGAVIAGPGNEGLVRVYSGLDGSTLHDFTGGIIQEGVGHAVAGAGDLNGDGHDDIIVGAPYADTTGPQSGRVYVFSGVDGAVLYLFDGASADDNFGAAIANVSDTNGDGTNDFVVGAPGVDIGPLSGAGRAYLYSGFTGNLLYSIDGQSESGFLGDSAAGVGDMNGDGLGDFLLGAPRADDLGVDAGSVRLVSGATGATLAAFSLGNPGASCGYAVANAGDVNGDGVTDFLIGCLQDSTIQPESGATMLVSGATGKVLYVAFGQEEEGWYGTGVAGLGDLDGDGFSEILVGQNGFTPDLDEPGSAWVYAGDDLFLNLMPTKRPIAGAGAVTLTATGDPAGGPMMIKLVGVNQSAQNRVLAQGQPNAAGILKTSGTIPVRFAGATLVFQTFQGSKKSFKERAEVQ